ncbi:MAG: hypothetical protein WCJ58_08395 [bacterium]
MNNLEQLKQNLILTKAETKQLDRKLQLLIKKETTPLWINFFKYFTGSAFFAIIIFIGLFFGRNLGEKSTITPVSAAEIIKNSISSLQQLKDNKGIVKMTSDIKYKNDPNFNFQEIQTTEWLNNSENKSVAEIRITGKDAVINQPDGTIVTRHSNNAIIFDYYNGVIHDIEQIYYNPGEILTAESLGKLRLQNTTAAYTISDYPDLPKYNKLEQITKFYSEVMLPSNQLQLVSLEKQYQISFESVSIVRGITINKQFIQEIPITYRYELLIDKATQLPISETINSLNADYPDQITINYNFETVTLSTTEAAALFEPVLREYRENLTNPFTITTGETKISGTLSIENYGETYYKAFITTTSGEKYALISNLLTTDYLFTEIPTLQARFYQGKTVTVSGKLGKLQRAIIEPVILVNSISLDSKIN